MSYNKKVKLLRKEARKYLAHQQEVFFEMIRGMTFKERLKLCWRILRGKI